MTEKKVDEAQEIKKQAEIVEEKIKKDEEQPEIKEDEPKKKTFRKEHEVDEPVEESGQKTLEVTVNPETAFNLKLQEFDQEIAKAKHRVTEIKMQKASFIYNSSLTIITEQHKAEIIRKQVEEETVKRTQDQNKEMAEQNKK